MNVLITGASRGLGKAIAEKFAGHGHQLFLSSRNKEALQEAVDSLKKKYPSVKINYREADLSLKEQAKQLGEWILQQQSPIDVLVNNAGSFMPGNVYNEKEGVLEEMM